MGQGSIELAGERERRGQREETRANSPGHSRAVLERMGRAFHVAAAGASCLFWRAATAEELMAAMARSTGRVGVKERGWGVNEVGCWSKNLWSKNL